MIRANIRRALEEDPGLGLAGLLHLAAILRAGIREVGEHWTAEIGAHEVAMQLGWTDDRVDKRWGPGADRARRYRNGGRDDDQD
jgi:hypothetical protein